MAFKLLILKVLRYLFKMTNLCLDMVSSFIFSALMAFLEIFVSWCFLDYEAVVIMAPHSGMNGTPFGLTVVPLSDIPLSASVDLARKENVMKMVCIFPRIH